MWEMLYAWYYYEGWVVILACLVLGLSLFQFVSFWRLRRIINSINMRQIGLEGKIIDQYGHAMTKINEVERRTTQTFPEESFQGNSDKTSSHKKKSKAKAKEPAADTKIVSVPDTIKPG